LSLTRAVVVVTDSAGVPYVYVPAGEFLMGSLDSVGDDNEHPQHTVYLDAFWIMQTEVTNAQYAKCVDAGACSAPDNSRWQDAAYADHPVTDVDWNQATEYAAWVGGRLPTEAEWEKAARGTDGRTYAWGEEQPDQSLANCCGFVNDTTPVGSYPAGASTYGALDMAGNVWEWTADWYDSGYYSRSPVQNPTGPSSGDYRVLRGGGYWGEAAVVRVANRVRFYPGFRNWAGGFRVVSSSPGS
jgi:formylglycine-generating enzyme required for sulfatase activity